MKRSLKNRTPILDGPSLDAVKVNFDENIDTSKYPVHLPTIKNLEEIKFPSQITFLVGENGSGKSTIIEAITNKAGFGP